MDIVSAMSIFATVWFGLWVIPAAVIDPQTRRFANAVNPRTVTYLIILLVMNMAVILPESPLSAATVFKVLVLSLLPFCSAYLMVRYYHSTVR